jgi:cyclohexa-1,5-dienecarbonyl-CoA hydratase
MAVHAQEHDGGELCNVRLGGPKGNVLDHRMVAGLRDAFVRAADARGLKAIVLDAEGPDFSFGASVEEHRLEHVGAMLEEFRSLFAAIARSAVTVLAAVRGQCLGGGLELAAFCHRLFAAPDSRLGQPEIKLGVFAPAASALLPERVGQRHADDLCLSGRTLDAEAALRIGLVDEIAPDPTAAAFAWARAHLLPRSAASLRVAVRAARLGFEQRFFATLSALERLYLEELMRTHDANEGIAAFLAKRSAVWRNT